MFILLDLLDLPLHIKQLLAMQLQKPVLKKEDIAASFDLLDRLVRELSSCRSTRLQLKCHNQRCSIICAAFLLLDYTARMTDDARSLLSAILAEPHWKLPDMVRSQLPDGSVIDCDLSDYVQFMICCWGGI